MSDPAPDSLGLEARKLAAETWFRELQAKLTAELNAIEAAAPADLYPGEPGRFEMKDWTRTEGGGGTMGLLRGRVFEKAGIHVSVVHGTFTPEMAKTMPGAEEDPRFFATGVSVIVHPKNPRMPTAHMNTRFICTTEAWFGGGGDLTPMLPDQRREDAPDTVAFHAAMQGACDAHHPDWYAAYKKEADEYFWLPHRKEPRGTGGIFYDRHRSGDVANDFAFTQDVGRAFLSVYPAICRGRLLEPWTDEERLQQRIQRGRYVEFNLLYDRGTVFGLKTGGNIESILSSMPPDVAWP
jgi:coproporphyrinogen III oxidase